MATPTCSLLTSGNSTSANTTFTTASVSVAANKLYIVKVYNVPATVANASSPSGITGAGLTFTKHVEINNTGAGIAGGVSAWRAMGSASSGTITITFPNSRTVCAWTVEEHDGVETSGSNGANAVNANTTTNSNTGGAGTSAACTLGAFASASNGASFLSSRVGAGAVATTTQDTGWTEISDSGNTLGGNSFTFDSQFIASNDTTVTGVFSAAGIIYSAAFEIVADGTAPSVGSASGTGDALGVSAATKATVGDAAGTGVATGVSAATKATVGSAAGVGDASGVGVAAIQSVGSASGTGVATGVAAPTFSGVGSSTGTGTATGVSAATKATVGAASATGVATGVSDYTYTGTTYYISPTGSNANNGLTSGTPFKTFAFAVAAMAAGDRLLLLDGTYSVAAGTGVLTHTGSGSAQPKSGINRTQPTTIAAVNAGLAIVSDASSPLFIGRSAGSGGKINYVTVDGIKFIGNGGSTIYYGDYNVIKNCGFLGTFSLGTNDNSQLSEYNLIQDCWFYASGARIIAINYRAHHNTWRRIVVRGDGCGTAACTGSGNPNVGFTCYDSQDNTFQNVIVIDRILAASPNVDEPYADFASAQHTASSQWYLGRNEWLGCMSIASQDAALNFEADDVIPTDVTWTLKNFIALNSGTVNSGGVNIGSAGRVIVENVTAVNYNSTNGGDGLRLVGPSTTNVTNYISKGWNRGLNSQIQPSYTDVFDNTTNYNQTTPTTGARTTDPQADTGPSLKYPVRIESGSTLSGAGLAGVDVGATVLYKYGTDDAIYGDSGYNTLTANTLWPFPNESRIKTDMAGVSTRGFCTTGLQLDGATTVTLTSYIWEFLGNQMPATIYGTGSTVGTASGTGVATGVSAATKATVGAASGTGTAAGVGAANYSGVGASTGAGTATGVSAATKATVGSASATGVALGVSDFASGGVNLAATVTCAVTTSGTLSIGKALDAVVVLRVTTRGLLDEPYIWDTRQGVAGNNRIKELKQKVANDDEFSQETQDIQDILQVVMTIWP